MNREEIITKLKFFYENKIHIHVDTSNEKYYNGLIFEIKEDYFVLHDRVLGRMPITISEIVNLERFREEKRDDCIWKIKRVEIL